MLFRKSGHPVPRGLRKSGIILSAVISVFWTLAFMVERLSDREISFPWHNGFAVMRITEGLRKWHYIFSSVFWTLAFMVERSGVCATGKYRFPWSRHNGLAVMRIPEVRPSGPRGCANPGFSGGQGVAQIRHHTFDCHQFLLDIGIHGGTQRCLRPESIVSCGHGIMGLRSCVSGSQAIRYREVAQIQHHTFDCKFLLGIGIHGGTQRC